MTTHPGGLSWASRLLIAFALMLAGASAAAWALARYDGAARFLGVAPTAPARLAMPLHQDRPAPEEPAAAAAGASAEDRQRIARLEARLRQLEVTARDAEGSAGRADGLLVAFAARRAMERGLTLGYLEPLLIERFGPTQPRAVSTIVTGAREPVLLEDLLADYRTLGPKLRSTAPEQGLWAEIKHEMGSLISLRTSDRPSTRPEARYRSALDLLSSGRVDAALAETMRLPGSRRAADWTARARRYVAVQQALDELETAALLGRTRQKAVPRGGQAPPNMIP